MQETGNSQSPHLHSPFEHVPSPDRSVSTHYHRKIRDDVRDKHDFRSLPIVDNLTNVFSEWGWSTSQDCEGRSQPGANISNQGLTRQKTASRSTDKRSDRDDSAQAQRIPTAITQLEQTSFTGEYGVFTKVLYYNNTSTVQLFEKKAPVSQPILSPTQPRKGFMLTKLRRASMPKSTIRELYAVRVFHHTKANLGRVPNLPRGRSRRPPLSHPNIVSILDILYNKQGNICLVMPYCTGGNLHAFLQQEARANDGLSLEEINCLNVQILRAIGFLHEHGISYGDLRPEHVLLTTRGAVKVGGFGGNEDAVRELVAFSRREDSTSPQSGPSPGNSREFNSKLLLCVRRSVSELSTPYLPPERFSGRRDSVRQGYTHQDMYDVRAGDIWACGMIYMILQSGRLPWRTTRTVDPDKSYTEYLHCRLMQNGYGPIQALENVSYRSDRARFHTLSMNIISNSS
ncbi:kinase-like domain-containing protein [Penicillium waksmanii]|uniref:kinase-like domain-containing protein n=1 Tax=Penicillium waksmanii TaxID=69791 RepID=UPI00254822B3|nr:kinase-like domain-containing protein [Penicillium waksmanii]KAJ6001189.1 kinase-like domain-containing protein [Penicillium waksmanii]